MTRIARTSRFVVLCLTAALVAGVGAAQQVFGTKDYNITKVAAVSFVPADSGQAYHTSGSLGRYGALNTDTHFYATLDLPAGIIIDYIGFNNLNDGTPGVMGIALWDRAGGTSRLIASLDCTAHTTWATDSSPVPLNLHLLGRSDAVFVLDVEIASSPNLQFFGWVGVWWRRDVYPYPAVQHFSDVPATSQWFKYVEALYAAGITTGIGNGLYGFNEPVTRGQMAIFLSRALGLHWPN